MRRALIILALIVSCVSPLEAQQRDLRIKKQQEEPLVERRTALVIGNSTYEMGSLKNPTNDAQDMARALRRLGFQVIYRENLTLALMKRAIQEFGAQLRASGKKGVGLFYFAGHGVQVAGENYLVPVDARIAAGTEIEDKTVNFGLALKEIGTAGNLVNILILDACRNNPFGRSFRSLSNGLAKISAPSGTIIAYATAPDSVASDGTGRNGTYTEQLLRAVQIPNLKIEDMFKRVRIAVQEKTKNDQTPWESSSLTVDFYFARTGIEQIDPIPEPVVVSQPKPTLPSVTKSNEDKKDYPDEPNIEGLEVSKSKKGGIAEGQQKEYKIRGVANVALRFAFPQGNFSKLTGRYAVEIYDSRGKQLKREMVYPNKGKEMVFTPQADGWYVLRLTGQYGYGNYTVYLDRL